MGGWTLSPPTAVYIATVAGMMKIAVEAEIWLVAQKIESESVKLSCDKRLER